MEAPVRAFAMIGICALDGKRTYDTAVPMLGDGDGFVHFAALSALSSCQDRRATRLLVTVLLFDTEASDRGVVALGLSNYTGENVVPYLARAFKSEKEANVRVTIANALRDLPPTQETFDTLGAAANDPDENVRKAAAEALAAIAKKGK